MTCRGCGQTIEMVIVDPGVTLEPHPGVTFRTPDRAEPVDHACRGRAAVDAS